MELYEPSNSTRTVGNRRTKIEDIGQRYSKNGGMTRSGRCYASVNLKAKKKEESVEGGKVKITILKGKGKEVINKLITEAEVNEFLKFIKHSEYSIVEQLHKISLLALMLALMLNSEPHREAMLKVLKQAYVPHNVPVDKIDRLVGNIMMTITSLSVMMKSHQMVEIGRAHV